jgi:hypothetical protein
MCPSSGETTVFMRHLVLDGQSPNKKENVSKNDTWSVTAGNASKMLILLPTELS